MRSAQLQVYGLITLLLIVGSSLFFYRYLALNIPLSERSTVNNWMVEANLHFKAGQNIPIKASFIIPNNSPNFTLLDEYFISHNYGVITDIIGNNRKSVWSLRRGSGNQSLYYRAILQETDNHNIPLSAPQIVQKHEIRDNLKPAIDSIVNEVRQSSADIQTFAQATIKFLNQKNDKARILVNGQFTDENIVNAAILILNQANIIGMPISGYLLTKQITNPELTTWLLIHNDREWLAINPQTSHVTLPKNLLIWRYGNEPMFSVSGADRPVFTINVTSAPSDALALANQQGLKADSPLIRFSLLQLPINTQEVYKILLMIPVGAFILLLLRNFVGLSTFGTFMPVLIALAFRETSLAWGITLFSIIVFFGLLLRFYLNQLHLLVVPRLAVILCFVVVLSMFISIFSQNLNITTGLSISLFPMVILTMTIERMCIIWDERGAASAVRSSIESLIAAVVIFFAINIKPLQYLLFAFPELIFIIMAMLILFGQYRGYRLSELFRFNALVKKQS